MIETRQDIKLTNNNENQDIYWINLIKDEDICSPVINTCSILKMEQHVCL